MTKRRLDRGYTLIELLLVIVVLAVLATVVVAAVGGFTADAEDSACKADTHNLAVAAESFFAQRATSMIRADDHDATSRTFERLHSRTLPATPSTHYDLDATGHLLAVGSTCGP